MRNLVSIEGAPLDEELAQQYFDALPERARAFLERLEEEADQNRASYEAQLQACNTYEAQLKEAEDRHDAYRRIGDSHCVARRLRNVVLSLSNVRYATELRSEA